MNKHYDTKRGYVRNICPSGEAVGRKHVYCIAECLNVPQNPCVPSRSPYLLRAPIQFLTLHYAHRRELHTGLGFGLGWGQRRKVFWNINVYER